MSPLSNPHGQPIGAPLPDWKPARLPPRAPLEGRWCRLEPVEPDRHASDLFEAVSEDRSGASFTYMGYEPFATEGDYRAWMAATCLGDDPRFFAIVDRASGRAVGVASLLRIDPRVGTIEVGHIHYSPRLQRTRQAAEAMFLLMRLVFRDLGYRRYEWKCDALNEPSRHAAVRYGFTFEGIFRQATIYKGRNRDTAWFAMIDREWPALEAAYAQWLDPSNFDDQGKQRRKLGELTALALAEARARDAAG